MHLLYRAAAPFTVDCREDIHKEMRLTYGPFLYFALYYALHYGLHHALYYDSVQDKRYNSVCLCKAKI